MSDVYIVTNLILHSNVEEKQDKRTHNENNEVFKIQSFFKCLALLMEYIFLTTQFILKSITWCLYVAPNILLLQQLLQSNEYVNYQSMSITPS